MTTEEIYAAEPGPELDALVHRCYGNGSPAVPPYSSDFQTVSRSAATFGLKLRPERIGMLGRHVIMSLFREGRYLEIGDSIEVDPVGEIDFPPAILATLAARSMLKLAKRDGKLDSGNLVAVGTPVAQRPPHRSVRER